MLCYLKAIYIKSFHISNNAVMQYKNHVICACCILHNAKRMDFWEDFIMEATFVHSDIIFS